LDDVRAFEEFRPADRVAVVFAVADRRIRAGREQQPHDSCVTVPSRKVQWRRTRSVRRRWIGA